ncbi:MAG: family 1 encapsulin nanocompartment shell protein [Kiritimatiellia bacterium]
MSNSYLHREEAPFGAGVWERVDAAVTGIAKARLAGRRLLEVDGPHGYALTVAGACEFDGEEGGARIRVRRNQPASGIECPFTLGVADIAVFEQTGQPLDLVSAARAAAACADREDDLVFYGSKKLGLTGLINGPGVQSVALTPWKAVGSAMDNVLLAVDKLDAAGFHGPYALALSPVLYNRLFRLFPQTGCSELEQLRQAVTGGVVKAPALNGAGVLVTAVREVAAILIGQDLETAFVGPTGRDYEFVVAETLALQLKEPSSVCVLK